MATAHHAAASLTACLRRRNSSATQIPTDRTLYAPSAQGDWVARTRYSTIGLASIMPPPRAYASVTTRSAALSRMIPRISTVTRRDRLHQNLWVFNPRSAATGRRDSLESPEYPALAAQFELLKRLRIPRSPDK